MYDIYTIYIGQGHLLQPDLRPVQALPHREGLDGAGAPVLHPQQQGRVLQPLSPQGQAVARSSKVKVFCQNISWTRPKVFLF